MYSKINYCEICNKEFSRNDNYQRHLLSGEHKMKINEQQKEKVKYKCDLCNIKIRDKYDYSKHILSNSHLIKAGKQENKILKNYSCDKCNFTTKKKDHMTRHTNTHLKSTIKCEWCNSKIFKNQDLYDKHRLSDSHKLKIVLIISSYRVKLKKIEKNNPQKETIDLENYKNKYVLANEELKHINTERNKTCTE